MKRTQRFIPLLAVFILICLSACGMAVQANIPYPPGETAAKEIGVFDFVTRTVLLNSGYEMPREMHRV